MTEQEFDELIAKMEKATGEKIDAKVQEALKQLDPGVLTKVVNDSKTLKTQLEDVEKQNGKLEEALKAQGVAITKLKEGGGASKNISFKEAINKGLRDNIDALKSMKETNSKQGIRIEMKAAANMLLGTNIVSNAQIPQAEREAGITRVVRREPFILNIVGVGTINSNLWEWVQQVNPDGDAAMTAEGVKKAQIDFDLALAEASVKKVTAFIKVSKEMLDDVDLIEAEINEELREVINLKIDAQLLSGDGTGQNLTGILANATPFVPGSFATAVAQPNNADVLRVAINQINIAQFSPNYILLHPSDVTAMELEKASDGHYILPPFRSIDGTVVKGVPVVQNIGVAEGDYLVGDFNRSGVRFKEGLTFDVGYENDDFTKNFVTILAEARLVHRVKSNHYPAFVKGTFATDKLAITAP
tara:strand:- start:159 stop:1406 length:1248 start_codon:yes stop_codon:yes gene_type:complete